MSTVPNPQTTDSIELAGVDGYVFNGDNDTVTRKCEFITLYREHGSIYHAAKLTPVSRKTVYRWMEQDAQFAEAVADSKEDSVDDLETSVYRRAFTDNLLAMFYLKAHRPKFRDKVTIDVEVVKNEIQERISQLGLKQLPMTTSEFLNSGEANHTEALSSIPVQFSPPSEDLQKECDTQPASSSITPTDD
jgi:hypothetical protein